MTTGKFNRLLKKVNPKLTLRQRGYGDVIGLYAGKSGKSGYIARMTKGEQTVNGFRYMVPDPDNPMKLVPGNIQKRGRRTIIKLLKNYRWIKKPQQASMLMWGIER